MSSLVDEQTTSEYHHDIGKQIMNQLKTYCFFVYYERSHIGAQTNMMNLEKISFKLKEDKNQHAQKYGDNNKNVQLNFYDIENQSQISNSLHDLKVTAQQTKTKLIFFSSQALMVNFYVKAKFLNINIDNIPICIYTSGIHSDISKFLGWGEPGINNLSELSVNQIQRDVRKWVESPTQKIDIWSVQIKVLEEGGSIQKLNQNNGDLDKFKSNAHKQLFISNLSIGYHPQLLLNYEQRKSSKQTSLFNKLIYGIQGIKKFCCVGNTDMRQTTGVVKIDFVDQKGQHQIMKHLREADADEGSEYNIQAKSSSQGNRKNVLSIALSNIDRFFGQKVKGNSGSRMNDQKLQLLTFQSINEGTKIASISGRISMQFSPDQPVYLQVNDSCYRLQKPDSIKVESFGKARIIINKQTLCC